MGVSHWHARMHLDAFKDAGAVIVGVCDENQSVAAGFAAEYGCSAYERADELVNRAKPDFIMAMATHREMPLIANELVKMGIPFGVEKPIGRNAGEAARIVEEVDKRGVFATVPLVNRYSRIWEILGELDRQGRLGPVSHAHFRIVNGIPARYREAGVGWMLDPEISGGGSMRNLGIHAADAVVSLAGGGDCRVNCAALHSRIHREPVEEAGSALVTFGGAFATIEAGYSYPTRDAGGDFEWRIVTGNAYIVDDGPSVTVRTLDDDTLRAEQNITQSQRYNAFAKDTLERIRKGIGPRITIRDCWRAMKLIDDVYAAAGSVNDA